MDVRMPRTSGIEAVPPSRTLVPSTKIIMLTMSDEESDLYEAVKAGANGYLLKDVPGEEIADGVRRGPRRRLAHLAVDGLQAAGRVRPDQQAEPERPLERRRPAADRPRAGGARLVARGMANKEIAHQLFISENTVKNHVRNILEKLQLHSRMEAAMYAVRENLLEPGE